MPKKKKQTSNTRNNQNHDHDDDYRTLEKGKDADLCIFDLNNKLSMESLPDEI